MGGTTSTPLKKRGAWLARNRNTVYLAATDGDVTVYNLSGATRATLIKTDGANPPTVIRRQAQVDANNINIGFSCPVKKGDYWKEESNDADVIVFWIPLEP